MLLGICFKIIGVGRGARETEQMAELMVAEGRSWYMKVPFTLLCAFVCVGHFRNRKLKKLSELNVPLLQMDKANPSSRPEGWRERGP